MTAKVITFGLQKGGAAKTTTCAATAYILSQRYRVLAVDMDSQGNLTELMMQRDIYDFRGRTVLEALKEKNAEKYIHPCLENLDMLTATSMLATFSRYLFDEYKGTLIRQSRSGMIQGDIRNKLNTVLSETLEPVKSRYDFILIDTPPALGELTINALTASDGVVVVFKPSRFSTSALSAFFETIEVTKQRINPSLRVLGILPTLADTRRYHVTSYLDVIRDVYKDLVFNTIIKDKAATERLADNGFEDNDEIQEAIEQFVPFVQEVLERVAQEK